MRGRETTRPRPRSGDRRDHEAWLRRQRHDLLEHRRSSGRFSAEESVENDLASGDSETSTGEPSVDDIIYRSLSLADNPFAGPADEVIEDTVLYRSLPASLSPQEDAGEEEESMRSWLAARRPPLLRRQRAFANVFAQQASDAWAAGVVSA